MLRIVVFAFLILPWSMTASAQAEQDANVYGQSSTQPETTQRVGLGLRAGVWGDLAGAGPEASYHIMQDLDVGLYYFEGTNTLKDPETKIKSQVVGLQARYMVGELFNVTGGIAASQVVASYDEVHKDLTETSGTYRIDSVMVTGDISNRWHWDNGLFINADWVGATYSFNEKVTNDLVDRDFSSSDPANPGIEVRSATEKFAIRSTIGLGRTF
jgi:hypothetical protein